MVTSKLKGDRMEKVAYRKNSWFPMPRILGQVFASLSHPALRVYLALTVRGSGFRKKFSVSNLELMAAAITRPKTFRNARAELLKAELIEATATDGSGRIYEYRIADPRILPGDHNGAVGVADPGAVEAVPVPRETLHQALSPEPKLHQEQGSLTRGTLRP